MELPTVFLQFILQRYSGMNEGWVQLRHVRKVFTTGEETLVVLKDITVSVSPGTVLVITGQSGCGKSTLLHLIGGLEGVTAGEICVGDVQ
jgi:ABC-type lipoprotein export system ATPase subunit